RLDAAIEKLQSDIETLLNPFKPGLWMSCWSGDSGSKFKNKHLARAESKICHSWGGGSPDKSVPADNFGVLWAGILRVEQEGKYKFLIKADDWLGLTVDGKSVKHDTEVTLTKGDKEIKIVYTESNGNANVSIRWKPENGTEQELPASALFHDPKLIAKYEVK
ncbi:MAG TPA: PA14 domain-containing protein, partial [Planctomycetota bacterium]|nr:PA14 domain-containing protein [Planctomycetota bacterium]